MSKRIPSVVETALAQNPGAEVTDQGVEYRHPGGQVEILVSFKNLKKDFFDGVEVVEATPIVTEKAPEAPSEIPSEESEAKVDEGKEEAPKEEVAPVEVAKEEVVEKPKAKPGPKPKAAPKA